MQNSATASAKKLYPDLDLFGDDET